MSDFGDLQPGVLEGAMQAILEGKRHARDLENFIDGVLPLLEEGEMAVKLEELRISAARAAHTLQELYNRNAREAFGAGHDTKRDSGRAGIIPTRLPRENEGNAS